MVASDKPLAHPDTFEAMRRAPLLEALLAACCCTEPASAQLRISEVCSNNQGIDVGAGDSHPDWIELVNEGSVPIDLSTYYLSDKPSQPGQWPLPLIALAPGEYALLIRGDQTWQFPFGIDAAGERIVLSDASLQPVQVLDVPAMRGDHSVGFVDGALRFFDVPTPGAANTTTPYIGYAPVPVISPGGGFYPNGTTASASAAFGTVHWSTTGRAPDESSPVASGTLSIGATTTVQARNYAAGHLASDAASATYIVGSGRGLPIVALAVDPDSMFNEEFGLYMPGPNASPEWPHYGANYWAERELPARFEFFEADGTRGIAQDVGVSIHGGRRSRTNAQRPLRLTARGSLGPETIHYPLFPERPTVRDYKRVILRNAGGDWCLANFRDGLFHQTALHNGLDIDALGFRPAECYINGEYWGLVEIRERIDADHLHYNYGADTDSLLLMEEENWSIQGDTSYSRALREFIRTADLNDEANWSQVEAQLDLHSLMDYFALEMIAGNVDWPSNNVKYWKPSVEQGKWRYLMYDLDATMVLYGWIEEDIDMMYWTFTHRAGSFHTELLRGLMGRNEFRRLFLNRKADLMNTVFSPARFQAEVDRITNAFAPVIEDHYDRWQCWYQAYLDHAFGIIPHFAAYRDSHIRQHVIDWYGFPNAALLRFESFPPAGGTLQINTIAPELPFDGWYWNGNDIDVTAVPAEGYAFSHWTYADDGTRATDPHLRRSFPIDGNLVAHFRPIDGSLSVFPNPTDGMVNLGFDAIEEGNARIRVTDPAGRVVLEGSVAVGEGVNRASIDLGAMPAGVYIVAVEADGGRQLARVVRQ
jgi:hypothetical protein